MVMDMEKKIQQAIVKVLDSRCGYRVSGKNIEVFKPRKEINGDYATNGALKNAKQVDMKAMELAILIADSVKEELTEFYKIEAVEPGFINFYLGDWYIYKKLDDINDLLDKNLGIVSPVNYSNMLSQDLIKSIQYIHSRTSSILKYYKKEGISPVNVEEMGIEAFENGLEKNIVKLISSYPAVIKDTMEKNQLEDLVQYLAELNDDFYRYHDLLLFRDLSDQRLFIVLKILKGFKKVVNHSLNLLGEDAPERM